MKIEGKSPYPNVIEVLRTVAVALDIKNSEKRLDDKSREKVVHPGEVEQLTSQVLDTGLRNTIGPKKASDITILFEESIERYRELVGNVSVDGVSRSQLTPLLHQGFWAGQIAVSLESVLEGKPFPKLASLLAEGSNAVREAIGWLESSNPHWNDFFRNLDKEQKDRIMEWAKLDEPELASLSSLKRVFSGMPEQENIKTLFLLARCIEYTKRNAPDLYQAVRLIYWGGQTVNFQRELSGLQVREQAKCASIREAVAALQNDLTPETSKKETDAKRLKNCIQQVRLALDELSTSAYKYWINWYDARWHVLSGDLKSANNLYKRAFEQGMYCAGRNLKCIIDEALVVASCEQTNDQTFRKKLKWASVTFKYDLPSAEASGYSSKASNTVEDWEVQLWRSSIYKIFPVQGMFPGCQLEEPRSKAKSNGFDIKVDLKRPDKKITIQVLHREKRLPQLVWFTELENFDAVSALLRKGATVNCASDVGDTPILMALEALNKSAIDTRSMDRRFFDLIAQHEHSADTINRRTQKRRLLPLISAIQSGEPDIVRKVLDMGADVNKRGQTDLQSPLNVCLKRLNWAKDSARAAYWQATTPHNPYIDDSVRRHTNGFFGHRLDDQASGAMRAVNSEWKRMIKETIRDQQLQTLAQSYSVEKMREIAIELIERGADPNAEHKAPLNGYTPLMLAAEWDEGELFQRMVEKGGDPKKHYIDPYNRVFRCTDIAEYFKSPSVLDVLQSCT